MEALRPFSQLRKAARCGVAGQIEMVLVLAAGGIGIYVDLRRNVALGGRRNVQFFRQIALRCERRQHGEQADQHAQRKQNAQYAFFHGSLPSFDLICAFMTARQDDPGRQTRRHVFLRFIDADTHF
jgi:hypothetical protein